MINKLYFIGLLINLLIKSIYSDDCINMWDTQPLESYANMCPGKINFINQFLLKIGKKFNLVQTVSGELCQFPFKYYSSTYSTCAVTTSTDNYPQCLTASKKYANCIGN